MLTPAALFDLDGTLTSGHVWNGLSRYSRNNRLNRHLYYSFLFSHIQLWLLSKIRLVNSETFVRRWARDMAIMLKGHSWEQGQEMFHCIVREELLPGLEPEIVDRLRWHQDKGHVVVLVSGTFQDLLLLVARELGVQFAIGSALETHDGRYTGRISGPLCFGKEKAKHITTFLKRELLEVGLSVSYAYGDRIQDRWMLEMVGNPVAVFPDKHLKSLAGAKGWPIIDRPMEGLEQEG